ncbi:hypothetical protein [uncultured Psychroserpens sp.]|uniref:hypothetical protein n=1 Tax=uncultured Psychroserpens sp. TaxID=255436 RepID=UPI00262CBC13|nr:hypothetical protein [uncultured Psychroserpens sp.]
MIKQLLFLTALILAYYSTESQTITSNTNECIQNFTIEAKTISGNNQNVNDIIISWDFSETNDTQNLELTFEVQPLNACWNGLNGTNRSEVKTYKIVDFSENTVGNKTLAYNDLNCKCIKWKAIILNPTTNCETKTEWQFTSFL